MLNIQKEKTGGWMCNVRFVTAVASLTKKMWEVVVFLEVELRILPARRLDPGKFKGLGNGGNSTIAQNLLVFIPTSSLVHLLLVLIPFHQIWVIF